MGGKIAVSDPEFDEPRGDEPEMQRLFVGHSHPIIEEGAGEVGGAEARDQVPCQIDGVEFDMRDGVQERRAPGGSAIDLASRNRCGRDQFRQRRPGRAVRRGRERTEVKPAPAPCVGGAAGSRGLFSRLGGRKNRPRGVAQAGQSAQAP
jgi:hypothetical protein